jgi:hypothetical protein
LAIFLLAGITTGHSVPLRFEISAQSPGECRPGRLFVLLSSTNNPEPRFSLGRSGRDAPQTFARDLTGFVQGASVAIDDSAVGFPAPRLSALQPGDYFVQGLFHSNPDLRAPNAPGSLFSAVRKVHLDTSTTLPVKIELTDRVPQEELPAETDELRFVKIQSSLLTQFHGRPIFLRAGIVLPRNYQAEPSRRYPLWIRIGGLNARFTSITNLMARDASLSKTWHANDTPRFILMQLDGAGPCGDPYQINSDNSGPYGDALIRELIPFVENRFRAIDQPRARVLSGSSTGGWVALALQIFYPDFFNGAWSSCPDPVDFRALELVNIYQDENAYVNHEGRERPSERDLKGAVTLTMRQEVGMENMLGRGNRYTLSGEQWGAWNALCSPRGADGSPVPIWDPQTGKIDHDVAEHWKRYDLRLVLEHNWTVLSEKLRGKIHIAAGEADQYFLNSAVHLLDTSLARAEPAFDGSIVYGPGKGHGWSNVSVRKMLVQMKQATETNP